MIAKTLFAATALAIGVFAVQPQAAQAGVDVDVYLPGFGVGYGYGYPGYGYPGYGPGYGPGYDYPDYAPSKMSCFQGKQSLKWKGFKQINAFKCGGKLYGYTAKKNGNFYKIRLNSFNGHIVSINPI